MTAAPHVGCLIVMLTLLSASGASPKPPSAQPLPFSCATFPPDLTAAALRERFGERNVQRALVPWGGSEGDENPGTVLFAGDETATLQIFWRDGAAERHPAWVSVRGARSRWQTPAGVTLGTRLLELESLNRRPFRLLGFGNDVSGTVMSWAGGRLDAARADRCRLRMRLAVPWDRTRDGRSPMYRQLLGEREFSSGHPAMQSLDPAVYELFIQYR